MDNNQRDPKWANELLGNSNLTIGADGCVISSIGNAIGTTPDVVNTLLKQNGGFQGGLVVWSALTQAFPGITATVYSTYNNDAVKQQLANGNRVLVFVSATPIGGSGMHCVEYIGNGQLKDPWDGQIKPTNVYPDILGEWISIAGQWTQTPPNVTGSSINTVINANGLNTYGLDPTNEKSNQIVFDTWYKDSQGLLVPVEQYNALKSQVTDLQKQITELQSIHVTDTSEIAALNGSLSSLTASNKDYATQTLDAEKVTDTYTGYMDDIANHLKLSDNNQTDAQLHDEIIKEIVALQATQQTVESQIPSEKILTNWENGFKSIVDWILQHGLNDFLKQNGMQIVDLDGNPQDNAIADKVIAFLDDRFHHIDILDQAQQAVNTFATQVKKSKSLFTQLLGFLYTKS